MRIALDAMGGDYAPKNIVEGAVLALKEYPYIEKLFLVGDAVATGNELKRLDFKDARIEIFHASEVVSMKESAAKAVRHKKDASICRAVDLVKNGSAQAVVSAGHTGGSRGGLRPQTPDAERNRPAGHRLPAADTEQSFRFDRWGSKPGLKPGKPGSVCDYGLRFFGARPWLQQPFSRVDVDWRRRHAG